jgi:hypothetical protein
MTMEKYPPTLEPGNHLTMLALKAATLPPLVQNPKKA